MEEVVDGEVLISAFGTPYDNGEGLWNVSNPTDGLSSFCTIIFSSGLLLEVSPLAISIAEGDGYQDASVYTLQQIKCTPYTG